MFGFGKKKKDQPRNITSAELAKLLFGGVETDAGISVSEESAKKNVAVMAAIRILAEGVASIPIMVYERQGVNGKVRTKEHPVARLLQNSGKPNDKQTPYEFKEMMQASSCSRGDGYAFINRLDGEPRELIPLDHSRVEPFLDTRERIKYKYRSSDGLRIIPAQDMFHLRGLWLGGLTGVSPLRYHRETIGLAQAAERHGSVMFKNNATPGGILSTTEKLSSERRLEIQTQWEGAFSGGKAFRTLVLDGNTYTWNPFSISNEDAQYLDTRKFQITEIARMFRVPPHMLADLERATFSNIEEQSLSFVRDALMAWIQRFEQRINFHLFSEEERPRFFAEFNMEGLLRGDTKTRSEFYWRMFSMGVMNPNEIREKENMNPRDGGDEYFVPTNMTADPLALTKEKAKQ